MGIISFDIPASAWKLISSDVTISLSLYNFLKLGVTDTIVLLTFGLFNTPLSRNGLCVGHVVYWQDGTVTVSKTDSEKSTLLKTIIDSDGNPSPQECTILFDDCYAD